MARTAYVVNITPVTVPGATNPTATSFVALTIDRLAVIHEDSSAETRGPYVACYFRVTSSGAGAGLWVFPATFGFRIQVAYAGDAAPTSLVERTRAQGDNPWDTIAITGAGSHWLSIDTDGNGAMLDFDPITAEPTATAPVPSTSATADVERFTLDTTKTAERILFSLQGA